MDIKNIGEEAVNKYFALPSDLNEVKRSGRLSDNLYGFKNFTQNDQSIAGLSINIPVSNALDIYMGTFNSYDFLRKGRNISQTIYNDPIFQYDFQEKQIQYHSKNKIQTKLTLPKIKINTDINYVYLNNGLNHLIDKSKSEENYTFNKDQISHNFYVNNGIEYRLNEDWGLSGNTSYSKESFPVSINTNYDPLLEIFQLRDSFFQTISSEETGLLNEIKFHKKTKLGTHTMGLKSWTDGLNNRKHSTAEEFSSELIESKFQINSILYDQCRLVKPKPQYFVIY